MDDQLQATGPVDPETPRVVGGATRPQSTAHGGGILVVDDTPSALHLLVDLLGSAGYFVRAASSGELALRSAFRDPPELVLLDVMMPGIDGYEVCRRLMAEPSTKDVPVIFLSALSDPESKVRGLEVGARDFISKPLQGEEVLARVRVHLGLSRAMRALDSMCIDLQHEVIERSTDIADLTQSLDDQVAKHRETARMLQLAGRAIESAHDAIIITGKTGEVVAANPASTRLTGYRESELLGRRLQDLFEEGDMGARHFAEAMTGDLSINWAGELWMRQSSGNPIPVWMSLAEFRDVTAQVTHYVAVFSDISQRKESEAKIRYLAEHDLLTGLPNRLLLNDRFNVSKAAALREGHHLAVLFVDIDKFKTINDSMGHAVGDFYLKAVAQAVGGALRGSDALCRVGGDEFLALVSDVRSIPEISAVAQRIRRQMDREFDVAGHSIRRTVSIGIALYPDDGTEFDDLARKADTAMYLAKRAGRDAVIFHTEQMNVQLQRRLDIEDALRAAIFNDELFMHYQPQVDLATGRIAGLEALVRWHRTGVGDIPPGDFIDIAEDSGLIIELGRRVTTLVCNQVRAWLDAGIAVPVAINVSPVQILHGTVDVMIMQALEKAGVPGSLIEIEVTESGLIDDTSKTQEMVARLLEHGVRLSIDDFLTGYSNFTYLRQFRPSHLKIDQSFVSNLDAGSENEAIVQAAIQMAEVLGIPTIAEGVETPEQARLLKVAGCAVGQGFLFSRPVPADVATDLLSRYVNEPFWAVDDTHANEQSQTTGLREVSTP